MKLSQENIKQLEIAKRKVESKLICRYKGGFTLINTENTPVFIKDSEEESYSPPFFYKKYIKNRKRIFKSIAKTRCEEKHHIARIILQSFLFINLGKNKGKTVKSISNFKIVEI